MDARFIISITQEIMKITEITASFGSTIQINAYEPLNFHASIKAEVAEGEDIDKAYKELFGMARKQVREQISEVRDNKKNGERRSQKESERKLDLPTYGKGKDDNKEPTEDQIQRINDLATELKFTEEDIEYNIGEVITAKQAHTIIRYLEGLKNEQ